MLKRFTILIIALLYLATVPGFALNLHYCFNRVSSVSVNVPVKSCELHAAKERKCCKHKQLDIKIKDSHQVTKHASSPKLFVSYLLGVYASHNIFRIAFAHVAAPAYRGPPDVQGNPVYLTIRNFRI